MRPAAKEGLRLRRAVSTRAEPITPYQYYSEVGEAIYAWDESYLHLNSAGAPLAAVGLGQGEDLPDIEAWRDDFEAADIADEDFATLLHEMHLAAEAHPHQGYAEAALEKLRGMSPKAPIIIGGCGRSGTTLLLSILGAHPEVLALPEEMYAFYPFPFRLNALIEALEAASGWQHWCEKTPKNVRAFPEIHAAFEGQVRLIHIVRDGRDVVTSHHPNAEERYYVAPERWVADVGAGWAQREKTLLVRYEDLVSQPRATLEVLCDYIGLDFDERLLQFEQHSSVRANKAWEGGTATALHSQRVARWQAPEHAERVAAFMATPGAQELMALLDYA